MSELPPRIQELISTPTRQQIFDVIVTQKDGFTFSDVFTALEAKKVDVSITSVQNFLKALCYRRFLKEYNLKESKTPGRSTIHYKRLAK